MYKLIGKFLGLFRYSHRAYEDEYGNQYITAEPDAFFIFSNTGFDPFTMGCIERVEENKYGLYRRTGDYILSKYALVFKGKLDNPDIFKFKFKSSKAEPTRLSLTTKKIKTI